MSQAQCDVLNNTNFNASTLAQLGSEDSYSMLKLDSPDYIDIASLRADLDVLATLPDTPEIQAQYHTVPSELIPQYRELLDLITSNVQSGSQPFSDGSGNGQKAVDLATQLFGKELVFAFTIAQVCP